MTLTPAYGRDYRSMKEVIADMLAGKDFIIADAFHKYDGKPINRQDLLGQQVNVRYSKDRKVCSFLVK